MRRATNPWYLSENHYKSGISVVTYFLQIEVETLATLFPCISLDINITLVLALSYARYE